MAMAHNGIIRGLNSIYLQATALPEGDARTVRDFLTYCQCWCESMHHHHDVEEESFFPAIEQLSSVPGLMEQNVLQHAAFTPGFNAFHEYVQKCSVKDYDGSEIRRLVEGFAEPLTLHLSDEIDTLRALNKFDSARVRKAYDQLDGRLRNTDNVSSERWLVKCAISADCATATHCAVGVWHRGQDLRGRQTPLPGRTILCAVRDPLHFRAAAFGRLAVQPVYKLERSAGVGVQAGRMTTELVWRAHGIM